MAHPKSAVGTGRQSIRNNPAAPSLSILTLEHREVAFRTDSSGSLVIWECFSQTGLPLRTGAVTHRRVGGGQGQHGPAQSTALPSLGHIGGTMRPEPRGLTPDKAQQDQVEAAQMGRWRGGPGRGEPIRDAYRAAVSGKPDSSPRGPTRPQIPVQGSPVPSSPDPPVGRSNSPNIQKMETQQTAQKNLSGDFQHTRRRGCSKFRASTSRNCACRCTPTDLIAEPPGRCGPPEDPGPSPTGSNRPRPSDPPAPPCLTPAFPQTPSP